MPDIPVRGLDDETVKRLKARAKRNGRSLQGEAKRVLEQAAGANADEVAAMGRRRSLSVVVFLCVIVTVLGFEQPGENTLIAEPSWITSKTPVKNDSIPDSDMSYLRAWIERHSQPAADYLVSLFQRHQVVILGEFHNVREHKEILISLMPRLYRDAGVRVISWEFSSQADNERLHALVTARDYDPMAALDFARDQLGHTWNSKEHWDVIEAVWRLNNSLRPDEEPMQLVGLTCDMFQLVSEIRSELQTAVQNEARDSPEFQELISRHDATMAEKAEQIISSGQKVLIFVGRCHDFTHYEFTREQNFGRPIMGKILHDKYGDRVFQVWLGSGGFLPTLRRAVGSAFKEPIGFDLYASPFATILSPGEWNDAPEVPMGKLARGYVYFGAPASLHRNTPIKGFVTEEMFLRYREFYEQDYGRTFENAKEFDVWLQEHRFPM